MKIKRKKRVIRTAALPVIILAVLAAAAAFGRRQPDFRVEEYHITIPGLKNEYRLLYLADMHIIEESEGMSDEDAETVRQRIEAFTDGQGTPSSALWQAIAKRADSFQADAFLMGGDMIDFASGENADALNAGLDEIETPFLYVRADHDYGVWYQNIDRQRAHALHWEIDGDEDVFSMDMGEFLIVGVSDNTSQITPEALEKIRALFAEGKPVILLLHVPLQSRLDKTLDQMSREVWQDRALIWGEDTYYVPDKTTRQFLDMVYAKDSPVREVLCGHLHFAYDGYLTEQVREYVAPPAYSGEITLITVS